MSVFPIAEMVVVDIAGSAARVQCDDMSKADVLRRLGFERSSQYWSKSIETPIARVQLVSELVGADAIFSEGRDWSPAELVKMYVEQGVIAGPYRVIRWFDPKTFEISVVHAN